jgi:hypothetical protein
LFRFGIPAFITQGDSMSKSTTNKGLMTLGLIFIFACILLFLAGMFAPRAIGFLDGLVCPDGMQLGKDTQQQVNDEGNTVDATTTVCVGEGRAAVDVTPRMLALLFGLAIAGGVFIIWSVGGIKRVS